MKNVDLYGRVPGLLAFSFPPGYRRSQPDPKLDALIRLGQMWQISSRLSWFQRSSDTRRNGYLNDCVMSMTLKAASRL